MGDALNQSLDNVEKVASSKVKGMAAGAADTQMTAKQLSDINGFWLTHQNDPQAIVDGMKQFEVKASDLAAATGQTIDQVGAWLSKSAAAATVDDRKAALPSSIGNGNEPSIWDAWKPTYNLSGDIENPWVMPGYKGSSPDYLTPHMQNTTHGPQWDNAMANLLRTSGSSPDGMQKVMDAMTKYGYSAQDMANITGTSFNDISLALRQAGAAPGFAGTGTAVNNSGLADQDAWKGWTGGSFQTAQHNSYLRPQDAAALKANLLVTLNNPRYQTGGAIGVSAPDYAAAFGMSEMDAMQQLAKIAGRAPGGIDQHGYVIGDSQWGPTSTVRGVRASA